MNAEMVMIGTELLIGQIVDSNAAHIGQVLAANGIPLYRKTTVGDNRARIAAALEEALGRADAVLTSGGLGPTEDDLTREAVSDVVGRPLVFHAAVCDHIASLFARVGRPMTPNNRKQAYAPEGAQIIPNPNGTAPGILVESGRGVIVCMPGVPHELYAMLEDSVVPYLRGRFQVQDVMRSRVLKVCAMGESRVDAAIGELMASAANPTIGVLASPEAVRIRIMARAATPEEAERLIGEMDARIRERLPEAIMGIDEDTLEGVVDELLTRRRWAIATSESDTGGMIAQRFVAAGAPSFAGGVVRVIWAGADIQEEARRRAEEIRATLGAPCGLALVRESDGEKTACAFVTPAGKTEWEIQFPFSGAQRQVRITVAALERVRRYLVALG